MYFSAIRKRRQNINLFIRLLSGQGNLTQFEFENLYKSFEYALNKHVNL